MTTTPSEQEPRLCARCKRALRTGEPSQCFTPSWCAAWPGPQMARPARRAQEEPGNA